MNLKVSRGNKGKGTWQKQKINDLNGLARGWRAPKYGLRGGVLRIVFQKKKINPG